MDWHRFKQENWRQRPCVIPQVERSIGGEAECRRAVQSLASLTRHDATAHAPRLILDKGIGEFFFHTGEFTKAPTLRSALEKVAQSEAAEESYLVVNNVQALDSELYLNCLGLLEEMYEVLGRPAGGALLDLFAGTHRKSPLGLHKDSQEVFTFVVEGEKTFYAWPFDAFAQRKGLSQRQADVTVPLDEVDPTDYLNSAIELRARPGDLIYWPASHWHVALSPSSTFSTTLALGLFPHSEKPFFLANRVAEQLTEEGIYHDLSQTSGPLSTASEHGVRWQQSWFDHPSFQERLHREWARWHSACGFSHIPNLGAKPLLDPNQPLHREGRGMFQWMEEDDALAVYWAGQDFRFVKTKEMTALLSCLEESEPRTLAEFLAGAERPHTTAETKTQLATAVFVLYHAGFLTQ